MLMRNIILGLVIASILFSCGNVKEESTQNLEEAKIRYNSAYFIVSGY